MLGFGALAETALAEIPRLPGSTFQFNQARAPFWVPAYDLSPTFWQGAPQPSAQPRLAQKTPKATLYVWRYDQVDAPPWLGHPVGLPLVLSRSPKQARAPFRVPAYDLNPGLWLGTPIASPQARLALQQPQAKIYLWRFDQVEQPFWLGKPTAQPIALTQFSTQTRQPFWAPGHDTNLQALWQGAPIGSPQPRLAIRSQNAPIYLWRFDQVEAPPWVGRPVGLPAIMRAQRAPIYLWRFDQIEAPPWLGRPIAQPLALTHGPRHQARAPFRVPTYDLTPALWQGAPIPSPQPRLALPPTKAGLYYWRFDQVEAPNWPPWLGSPIKSPPVVLTIRSAHQARAPFRVPSYDLTPAIWQGAPLAWPLVRLLTAQKIYGAPGQVPTKFWTPSYDLTPTLWQIGPQATSINILNPFPPIPPTPPFVLPPGGGGHRKPIRPIWDIQRERDSAPPPVIAPAAAPQPVKPKSVFDKPWPKIGPPPAPVAAAPAPQPLRPPPAPTGANARLGEADDSSQAQATAIATGAANAAEEHDGVTAAAATGRPQTADLTAREERDTAQGSGSANDDDEAIALLLDE
jgi:hypothetical protein